MIRVTCPHCNRNTEIDAIGIDDPNTDYEEVCDVCNKLFYVSVQYDSDGYPTFKTLIIEVF